MINYGYLFGITAGHVGKMIATFYCLFRHTTYGVLESVGNTLYIHVVYMIFEAI
jgi:hypothetical protein